MLALWLLHAAAGAGLLRHGASCSSCLALHPAVLGRAGTEEVCVGTEERYDAGCSKCTAARGACLAPALLQQRARSRGCPPPQPCTCNCNCPEIVFPVPPPLPLLPTPLPGLIQTGATVNLQTGVLPSFLQTAAKTAATTVQRRSWIQQGQPVPGMALPPPGAPINMLPPPPMPPLPPMPPDPRVQECPVNTPCTCYCHCKNPRAAAAHHDAAAHDDAVAVEQHDDDAAACCRRSRAASPGPGGAAAQGLALRGPGVDRAAGHLARQARLLRQTFRDR